MFFSPPYKMRKFLGTPGGTKNTHFICYRGKGVIFHTLYSYRTEVFRL